MVAFTEQYGPWALVTGASSGIGAEFARQLAAEKLNLVLVARSKDKLEAAAASLRKEHGIEARAVAADLSRVDFLETLGPAIEDLEIGLLLNNAGFTLTGELLELDPARQLAMVDLNCRAPLALAHHLAAKMKERGRGGIVFTASVMGLGGAPMWATYNATKGFDLLLAEGMAAELEPHGVDVQALCPGGTRSGFQAAGSIDTTKFGFMEKFFVMDPPDVVRASLRGLGRKRVVVPGLMNKMMVLSMRWLPRSLNTWILGRVVSAMAH